MLCNDGLVPVGMIGWASAHGPKVFWGIFSHTEVNRKLQDQPRNDVLQVCGMQPRSGSCFFASQMHQQPNVFCGVVTPAEQEAHIFANHPRIGGFFSLTFCHALVWEEQWDSDATEPFSAAKDASLSQ